MHEWHRYEIRTREQTVNKVVSLEAATFAGLLQARDRLPMPLLGIDSDNGAEFINDHLRRYCETEHITFTRCRPYKKNDQAHIEQKNWSVVRRTVGYDRYDSPQALRQLQDLYQVLRLYLNYFQPVMKLVGKERFGARVKKRYDDARTPYQRIGGRGSVPDSQG